ncbi:interleukin-7 isoform X1 [Takifugu rubripes]|uniref:interleukin-7 isoform X1 n=1 Tax=Takifugu rubripes TaxID=31033 RepID=UPI0011459A1A|nr:interleukin-7 isoform X1 [Takifugu rubripes]
MPLLCISLLVLLLLPQSLTCDRNQLLRDAAELYNAIVKTDLDNTRENISASLQEISCPQLRFKAENCTPNTSGAPVMPQPPQQPKRVCR